MHSPSRRPEIRVLHVLNAATGGAARSALELIRELRRLGIEGQALVCHDMGAEEDHKALTEAVEGRILFCTLHWWNRKTGSEAWKRPALALLQGLKTGCGISSAMKVAEFASAQRSTVIHSNSFTINDGCRASRWLGLPHVWHLRELLGPDAPFHFPMREEAFEAYVRANSDIVIANSTESARRLREIAPGIPVVTIPNGIDVREFSCARDSRSRRSGGPVVVGMVANLTSRMKNHELFLDAAAMIPLDAKAEFRIYGLEGNSLAGGDSYTERLRRLAATDRLRGRVHFVGYVADPAAIMMELDVLVHPCAVESFGRVVLEAMAAGLPVVAIRAGGAMDLVRDQLTGFLVDQDDASGMARRIEDLTRSPLMRNQMGDQGRRRAESEFSLRSTAARVLDVYRGLHPQGRFDREPLASRTDQEMS